jgi:hypothetical protein
VVGFGLLILSGAMPADVFIYAMLKNTRLRQSLTMLGGVG